MSIDFVGFPGQEQTRSVQGTNSNTLGRSDFLRLLVAQLRNQDPLEPMESSAFAAQLAQFASVEQLFNINESLDRNLEMDLALNQSIGNTLATTVVGKGVRAQGNSIGYRDGEVTDIIYSMSAAAREVTLRIFDDNNTLIRTVDIGAKPAGLHSFDWDGRGDTGHHAVDGVYSFTVTAKNGQGNIIPSSLFMGGLVEAIEFGGSGNTFFIVGDLRISIGDAVRISERSG